MQLIMPAGGLFADLLQKPKVLVSGVLVMSAVCEVWTSCVAEPASGMQCVRRWGELPWAGLGADAGASKY